MGDFWQSLVEVELYILPDQISISSRVYSRVHELLVIVMFHLPLLIANCFSPDLIGLVHLHSLPLVAYIYKIVMNFYILGELPPIWLLLYLSSSFALHLVKLVALQVVQIFLALIDEEALEQIQLPLLFFEVL